MIDATTERRQLRAEIARLRRRIDRRVAAVVQSGRWVGGFVARRRVSAGWTLGLLAAMAAVGCLIGRRGRSDRRGAEPWAGIVCRTVLGWCCAAKPDNNDEQPADSDERQIDVQHLA